MVELEPRLDLGISLIFRRIAALAGGLRNFLRISSFGQRTLPFEKYDFLRIIPISLSITIVILFDRYKSLIAVRGERRGGNEGSAWCDVRYRSARGRDVAGPQPVMKPSVLRIRWLCCLSLEIGREPK